MPGRDAYLDGLLVRPRGEGPISSSFTPGPVGAIMGHARARLPENHLQAELERRVAASDILSAADVNRIAVH
jgi:hypothetical protein